MKPQPRDIKLYEKIKLKVYKDIPKHSAYRSGILVQKSTASKRSISSKSLWKEKAVLNSLEAY